MKLRCIAVDDEPLARRLLKENIEQIPFLELVSTCKNAFEAMEVLNSQAVDLIFLDIQMPGMIGTKFIQSLRTKPMVIFVTAYSNYAVESYDLEVIDYLLKPVSIERFTKAAYKALDAKKKDNSPLPVSESTLNDSFFVKAEYALSNYVGHIVIGFTIISIFGSIENRSLEFSVFAAILFNFFAIIFSFFMEKKISTWAARMVYEKINRLIRYLPVFWVFKTPS